MDEETSRKLASCRDFPRPAERVRRLEDIEKTHVPGRYPDAVLSVWWRFKEPVEVKNSAVEERGGA